MYALHTSVSASHSTFGWWMGYLSKGDKVYYTDIRATNDSRYLLGGFNPFDYYLPHWTPLKYDDDLNVIESKK
uniref:L-Fucosyltransferase n=1 Tax=Caenorhabditis tropicalis TaxID=1561998 RepID=A0A1I7TW77_9PELO